MRLTTAAIRHFHRASAQRIRKALRSPTSRAENAFLNAPSIRAFIVQLLSFTLVLTLSTPQLSIATAALLQGGIAALLSRAVGLASWWLLIQAVFPIALIAMLSLHLPPSIFLAAFVLLLGLYWSTFRTQVPFYPSGPSAWRSVASLLPPDRPIQFIDIGSGLGGLVLHLARRRKDSVFIGIELAPLPWFVSLVRRYSQRSSARFIRGDYDRLDFASYDVVFAYLSPAAMPALWHKARAEMRPGALLLSYEFNIPGAAPDLSVAAEGNGPALFGWYM